MHWREFSQVGLAPYPSDPGPGKIITADKWVETGSDQTILFSHILYTLPDGTLYQDVFANKTTSVIIRGPGYFSVDGPPPGGPPNPFWCVSQSAPHPSYGSFGYIDQQALTLDNFTQSLPTPARPIPSSPSVLPDVAPIQVFSVPTTVYSWQGTGPTPDKQGTSRIRFDADPQGRVIVSDIQHFDASGKLSFIQWYTIGQIAIYPTTTVLPAWVNAVPRQVKEGCNA